MASSPTATGGRSPTVSSRGARPSRRLTAGRSLGRLHDRARCRAPSGAAPVARRTDHDGTPGSRGFGSRGAPGGQDAAGALLYRDPGPVGLVAHVLHPLPGTPGGLDHPRRRHPLRQAPDLRGLPGSGASPVPAATTGPVSDATAVRPADSGTAPSAYRKVQCRGQLVPGFVFPQRVLRSASRLRLVSPASARLPPPFRGPPAHARSCAGSRLLRVPGGRLAGPPPRRGTACGGRRTPGGGR